MRSMATFRPNSDLPLAVVFGKPGQKPGFSFLLTSDDAGIAGSLTIGRRMGALREVADMRPGAALPQMAGAAIRQLGEVWRRISIRNL